MDDPSLSEEAKLVEIGQGAHTQSTKTRAHFTCSSGMNRKRSLLTNYIQY
jgi:hypothetical protein